MTKNTITVRALDSKGNECAADSADLMWLELKPSSKAILMEVGNKDRSQSQSVINWFEDWMLGFYSHKLTVLGQLHINQGADDVYDEKAGIMLPTHPLAEGKWRVARIELGPDGDPMVVPGDEITGELDTARVKRLRAKNASKEVIDKAKAIAENDAKKERNQLAKHRWAMYQSRGKGFKVYVAHLRDKAVVQYGIMVKSFTDLAGAIEDRNDHVDGKKFYDNVIRPIQKGNLHLPTAATADDEPDAPEGSEPVVVVHAPLIFRLVGPNNRLTGEEIDLFEHVGEQAILQEIRRDVAHYGRAQWFIDPENERAVADWRDYAALPSAAVKLG